MTLTGGIRWMNNELPKLRLLVEFIPDSSLYVATALDEAGYVCDAAGPTAYSAIQRCLTALPEVMARGRYDLRIDVLNPDVEDESAADSD